MTISFYSYNLLEEKIRKNAHHKPIDIRERNTKEMRSKLF
jgi:hypothetical protein